MSDYETQAIAQKRISIELVKLLYAHYPQGFERIWEFGCGSGFLTREILNHYNPDYYLLNDLYDRTENLNQYMSNTEHEYITGDAEIIEPKGSFNLICSSCTFQWLERKAHFIEKCSRLLDKNGVIALSTFLPGNLREIQSLTGIGLEYPDIEDLTQLLACDFDVITCIPDTIKLYFPDSISVLKHLSMTGVNGIKPFRWNKTSLAKFDQEYNRSFHSAKGLSLTYIAVYIIARKH